MYLWILRFFCLFCILHTRWAFAAPTAPLPDNGNQILVIGADGLSANVLDPLLDAGRLPNLAKLIATGTRATLVSERPMRSPALWTTIATGQPRHIHRVFDFVTGSSYWPPNERGKDRHLVTSAMRQSRAVWHWASDNGRKSLVVGWLNTWPAETIQGVMVAPYVALGKRRQSSIKGRIYDDIEHQTYPPTAFKQVQHLVVPTQDVPAAVVGQLMDEPPSDSALFQSIPRLRRYLYTVRWSLASGMTNTALLEHFLARDNFDLVMTYFDGSDTLAHRFWVLREPLPRIRARLVAHGYPAHLADELKQRFGRVLDEYYVYLDGVIGRLWRASGPKTNVLVLSDHGFGSYTGGDKAPHDQVPFDGQHLLDGVLIAAGPDIQHHSSAKLTQYDITPTILYLMGLAVPRELPGRIAKTIIKRSFLASHAKLVAAKKNKQTLKKTGQNGQPRAVSRPAPFADDEIERLRSLGYVQ